jgi:hypothetical protein
MVSCVLGAAIPLAVHQVFGPRVAVQGEWHRLPRAGGTLRLLTADWRAAVRERQWLYLSYGA